MKRADFGVERKCHGLTIASHAPSTSARCARRDQNFPKIRPLSFKSTDYVDFGPVCHFQRKFDLVSYTLFRFFFLMRLLKGSVSIHLVIFSFWYDLKEGLK